MFKSKIVIEKNSAMQQLLEMSLDKTIQSLSGLRDRIDYTPVYRDHFLEQLAQTWENHFPLSITRVSDALRELKKYSNKPFFFNVKKSELITHLRFMKEGKIKNNILN